MGRHCRHLHLGEIENNAPRPSALEALLTTMPTMVATCMEMIEPAKCAKCSNRLAPKFHGSVRCAGHFYGMGFTDKVLRSQQRR